MTLTGLYLLKNTDKLLGLGGISLTLSSTAVDRG
jgi:hypothetical protein